MPGQFLKWLIRVVVVIAVLGIAVIAVAIYLVADKPSPDIGRVDDEAKRAGRTVESLPAADEDYFKDMDHGIPLNRDEVQGRNNWIVWTGGNDRFWDFMANNTFGAFDLLKIVAPHPDYYYSRDNRWQYLGLVNEPCFEKTTAPDRSRWGLYLDQRDTACEPDPFANSNKYPGVEIGARAVDEAVEIGSLDNRTGRVELGSYYGEPSGVVGLRVFSNPDFDKAAQEKWDPERYYTDPDYYNDDKLVRPYRIGMSCGFCHVGPSPINPPEDSENPEWANLNSNPGAQYFWVDRIFFWDNKPPSYTVNDAYYAYGGNKPEVADNERNFIFQLFHTNPPGALDTSLVSTDYINNPRTMNAVYSLAARLGPAMRWGKSTLTGGELNNVQFADFPETQAFADTFVPPDTVYAAHVLKDGADSVGVLGALNRVYINIGLFSEEWTLHFRPVVGGREISPIEISVLNENSVYWQATEEQSPKVALFFVKTAQPDDLAKAPGGEDHLLAFDDPKVMQGRQVFAENCARCHSSKYPPAPAGIEDGECEGGGNGPQYLRCWDKFWKWSDSDDFKRQMTEIVMQDDFLEGNFLATERRIPSTLMQTNLCSPLATNALGGDIWDNFSSTSYKQLPAVGKVEIQHPFSGEHYDYDMPDGGVGYTRVTSLISLWSTAPYLQNNSVGTFYYEPSVEARLKSFQDSITKMLWPERRLTDAQLVKALGLPPEAAIADAPGYLYRTTASSCLKVPRGYLPEFVRPLTRFKPLASALGWVIDEEGNVVVGPIPKGTPVSLISNTRLVPETDNRLQRLGHWIKLVRLVGATTKALKEVGGTCSADDLAAIDADPMPVLRAYGKHGVADRLLSLSKCPDYVVNKGHYFGTELPDAGKLALIEFLKHL